MTRHKKRTHKKHHYKRHARRGGSFFGIGPPKKNDSIDWSAFNAYQQAHPSTGGSVGKMGAAKIPRRIGRISRSIRRGGSFRLP